jgi:hypothetical protein
MAALAVSSSAIGTTIPGSTTGSRTNKTGTDMASAINPSKVKSVALNPWGVGFVPWGRVEIAYRS